MTAGHTRSGGCLCGAVRFEVQVPEAKYSICHCGRCRRWSAGPMMAVHCPGKPTFTKDEGLTWYQGTDWAERGFCARCGSSLFWRLASDHAAMIIVAVDALDSTDDISLERHIYVDEQPARYVFGDDCPRATEAEVLAEFGITPNAGA